MLRADLCRLETSGAAVVVGVSAAAELVLPGMLSAAVGTMKAARSQQRLYLATWEIVRARTLFL